MSEWKIGNKFAPYHPSASHVKPRYRDGWNACYELATAELDKLRAEVEGLRADAERLDWLEATINEHGEIHLHDGQHPRGTGLGLRPGDAERTLREAIDAARSKE